MNFFSFAHNSYGALKPNEFLTLPSFNATINMAQVDIELIEAGVFHLSNEYRKKKSKDALSYNEQLSYAAYLHSEQMHIYKFFDHTNKKNNMLSSLEKRAIHAGYRNYNTLAENIFYGYINIQDIGTYKELSAFIVDAFISSKGHRDNLLANDVLEMGCGIYFDTIAKDGYWYFNFTQDFGSAVQKP